MVVVFPAPFGPMKPRIWPRPTESVSRSRASNDPYFFVSSRVSTSGPSLPISLPRHFQTDRFDLPGGPAFLDRHIQGQSAAFVEFQQARIDEFQPNRFRRAVGILQGNQLAIGESADAQ